MKNKRKASGPIIPILGEKIIGTKLTFLKQLEYTKMLCKCDCGTEKVLIRKNIFGLSARGETKSCGCFRKEKYPNLFNLEEHIQKLKIINLNPDRTEAAYNVRYNSVKNLGYNIGRKEWEKLVKSPCHYCGAINIAIVSFGRERKYKEKIVLNGVDKLVAGDITTLVPCCPQCNTMKWDYSIEEFFKKIGEIIKYQKQKGINII